MTPQQNNQLLELRSATGSTNTDYTSVRYSTFDGDNILVGLVELEDREIGGIKVGDLIQQVGVKTGGSVPLNRISQFKSFVTYRGVYQEEGIEYMMFEVREHERPVRGNLFPCYLTYRIIVSDDHMELGQWDVRYNAPRIFQLGFVKYDGTERT